MIKEIKYITLKSKTFIMKILNIHWQNYRDFFQITIFKYLVTWFAIVSLVVNLLSGFPNKVKVTEDFVISFSLPFKWECLWASSVFFIIAYLLYVIFCPTFIKKYFSLKVYLEYEHSPRWLTWEAFDLLKENEIIDDFISYMKTKKYITKSFREFDSNFVDRQEKQTVLYFNHKLENFELALPILNSNNDEDFEKTKIAVREIFWEIFGRYSSSRSKIRITILFFLALSLIFFLIPFVQSIINVFLFIFK